MNILVISPLTMLFLAVFLLCWWAFNAKAAFFIMIGFIVFLAVGGFFWAITPTEPSTPYHQIVGTCVGSDNVGGIRGKNIDGTYSCN